MIKVIQKSAKTEEEAIRLAIEESGLTRDDVSVEIIERAKSGFLGFGASPAIVSVTFEVPGEEPEPIAAPVEPVKSPSKPFAPKMSPAKSAPEKLPEKAAPEKVAKPEKLARPEKIDRTEKSERVSGAEASDTAEYQDKTGEIRAFLEGLLERFGVKAEIEIGETRDGTVEVVLTANEPGALIGRRGETLDSIQSLTNYAVNRGHSGRLRINIDTENYRLRRSETLEQLAEKTAAKVVRYHRSITLDPMNAYERHVIHTALQENEFVSTHSVGSEPNRRVVIAFGKSDGQGDAPARDFSPRREGSRGQGGGNDRGGRGSGRPSGDRQNYDRPARREAAPPVETSPKQEAHDDSSYSAETETPSYREWK
jgi:spoIIIJ-associated protein